MHTYTIKLPFKNSIQNYNLKNEVEGCLKTHNFANTSVKTARIFYLESALECTVSVLGLVDWIAP